MDLIPDNNIMMKTKRDPEMELLKRLLLVSYGSLLRCAGMVVSRFLEFTVKHLSILESTASNADSCFYLRNPLGYRT